MFLHKCDRFKNNRLENRNLDKDDFVSLEYIESIIPISFIETSISEFYFLEIDRTGFGEINDFVIFEEYKTKSRINIYVINTSLTSEDYLDIVIRKPDNTTDLNSKQILEHFKTITPNYNDFDDYLMKYFTSFEFSIANNDMLVNLIQGLTFKNVKSNRNYKINKFLK